MSTTLIDMKPFELGAVEASQKINKKELSSKELLESCMNRIDEVEPAVHAWKYFNKDIVLKQMEALNNNESDDFILKYIPVGIKDIYNTLDMPTCMGSPIWENFMPGNDARIVTYLKNAGMVAFGKTVTAEFAVHSPGPTINPYSKDHIAGTSSTGSAVAVSTGMVPVAIGSQTAGSTIRPASYSGVYGFKPSFGLVPRTGVLKTLDTLDHVTWFARNVIDVEEILNILRVKGHNYPYVNENIDNNIFDQDPSKLKVAFIHAPTWDNVEDYAKNSINEFVEKLKKSGIKVDDVEFPTCFNDAHNVHATVYNKALSYYFKEEYEESSDLISDVMKKMIINGQKINIDDYKKAIDGQNYLSHQLDEFFNDYDIIISHATSGEAPLISKPDEKDDACLIWTLCRVPVLFAPLFKGPSNLPYGVQFVAKRFDDYKLLSFTKFLREYKLVEDVVPIDPK